MEPGPAITVEVGDVQNHLPVAPAGVVAFVSSALAHEGVARADISIVIMDDKTIRAINSQHLGHDWATDVITFPLSLPGDPVLAGELVVSAQTAADSARELGVAPERELALYLLHGLLHLLGCDDQSATGAAEMRHREARLLSALGSDAICRLLA